ncbi:hypothetical protein MAR_005683 [Mya arenaria]|uniref:Uncharacterized protein n=1 Tax=Mya arenaria TaxID=6604 RepID=A0ABY7F4E2_MYAAR|nr:hypothetical protein MAR_005683 [Mya arenaria]
MLRQLSSLMCDFNYQYSRTLRTDVASVVAEQIKPLTQAVHGDTAPTTIPQWSLTALAVQGVFLGT